MLTEEQQRIRARGIGGSEIATLVGLNNYSTPFDLWYRKTGRLKEKQENFNLYRGTFLEDGIKRWTEQTLDISISDPGTIVHKDYPFIIATPDGVTNDGRVVEIKCPNWRTAEEWGEPGTDDIPASYIPQLIWEMAVTGLKRTLMVGYFRDDLHFYNIDWDQELFEILRDEAENFWKKHILTDIPPEIEVSDRAFEYVISKYEAPAGEMEATTKMYELAEKYNSIQNEIKELTDQKKLIQFQALQEMEGKKKAKGSFGSFTFIEESESRKVDWEGIISELGLAIPSETRVKHTKVSKRSPSVRCYIKKGAF